MARKIIYKNNGLNNQPDSPIGYKFVGYDNNTFSEKDGSVISAIGGGGSNIEKTYSELVTMKTNGTLDPGQLYLMTDFQTIYDQPDYSDANTPKTTVETKTASVSPIILLAISETEFAKEVWRPSTPKHTLEYDINFIETEYMNVPAKGRITYCKDEYDNETHYDHTVVLLKRYESVNGSGKFNSFWDTGFGSTEVLTFGVKSFSNKIGDHYYELGMFYSTQNKFHQSNNVFGERAIGNIIGIRSSNNTFGDYASSNTFGFNTRNNTFGNNTSNNTFGDNIFYNTFGNGIGNNNFGDNTSNNNFGDNVSNNNFGDNVSSNNFGYGIQNNTFGNSFQGNNLGNFIENNTFGNVTNGNTFGDTIQYNTFGDYMYNNDFGYFMQNNTFGNTIESNNFRGGASNNKFGNNIQMNYFWGSTSNNTFGDYINNNSFGGDASNNTFGNEIGDNNFGNFTEHNTFGNSVEMNNFGDYTQNNKFGNRIQNIDFTMSTHVYGEYSCNIFLRQDGTGRLSYYDDIDDLVVVDPTD